MRLFLPGNKQLFQLWNAKNIIFKMFQLKIYRYISYSCMKLVSFMYDTFHIHEMSNFRAEF